MSVSAPRAAAGAPPHTPPARAGGTSPAAAQSHALAELAIVVAAGVVPTAVALAPIAVALGVTVEALEALLHNLPALAPGGGRPSIPEQIANGVNLRARVLALIALGRKAAQGSSQAQLAAQIRAHLLASRARQGAARDVWRTSQQVGSPVLGWQAVLDQVTTAGCRAAHGNNFHIEQPPWIEGAPAYPGWPHGATCRCIAVPPFPDGKLLV